MRTKSQVHNRNDKNCKHVLSLESYFSLCNQSKELFGNFKKHRLSIQSFINLLLLLFEQRKKEGN